MWASYMTFIELDYLTMYIQARQSTTITSVSINCTQVTGTRVMGLYLVSYSGPLQHFGYHQIVWSTNYSAAAEFAHKKHKVSMSGV